jgi:hypothetical protein
MEADRTAKPRTPEMEEMIRQIASLREEVDLIREQPGIDAGLPSYYSSIT